MKWFLILFITHSTSIMSDQTSIVRILEPSEEVCRSVGNAMTIPSRKDVVVKSGTWSDGKPWKITRSEWTNPKFDDYECVPGEE